eukprot:COSAG01_NODE_1688_length_9488_cov_35.125466_5_plen_60_part_01
MPVPLLVAVSAYVDVPGICVALRCCSAADPDLIDLLIGNKVQMQIPTIESGGGRRCEINV